MNVVTVYTSNNGGKGGNVYSPEWVVKLRNGLREASPFSFRFDCLAEWDMDPGWPGWWSKIELFRPGRFSGWTIFMDLDTLPVGDLGDTFALRGAFFALRDFGHHDRLQSAVMAWRPGEVSNMIWSRFMEGPNAVMGSYRSDQEFIEAVFRDAGFTPSYWQDYLPGQMVSLKWHALDGPPEDARLVCGHGDPRFSDPGAGWAHDTWRKR